MIRLLTLADQQAIETFACRRERENLFIIESLRTPEKFGENRYWGYEERGELLGVAVFFGRWGSFVAASDKKEVIEALTDAAVESGVEIEAVPAIRRQGEIVVERLAAHGKTALRNERSHLLELPVERFRPRGAHPTRPATDGDVDALVILQRDLSGTEKDAAVTETDRRRIDLAGTVVTETDGRIVSKATIGARSRHYAQLVGVVTDIAYRRQGYALSCVSALCSRCFSEGTGAMLLFTGKENAPAQRLYASLGFRLVDDFLLARFA